MKTLALLFGLAFAGEVLAADQSPYAFIEVPHSEIDQHLVIGSDATETPAALQGLWWMDGNPMHDEVMSFANARFTDIKVLGRLVGHEALVTVYDQGIWSWHGTEAGRKDYELARATRLTYHLYFNADYSHGLITPIVKFTPKFIGLEIPFNPLANFTMDLVNPNEYSRDSSVFGKKNHYRFRRIVDGKGQRLPAFDEFVRQMETESLPTATLPICALDSQTTALPTPCAAL